MNLIITGSILSSHRPRRCPRALFSAQPFKELLLVVSQRDPSPKVSLFFERDEEDFLTNENSSICYQRCGSAPIRPRWSYVLIIFFFGRLSLHAHPAIIKGTVNDPTPFPTSSRTHGSHHWAFERLLSASLVPLTAAAFVTSGSSYPVLDGVLAVSLVMHSHLGVRSLHLKRPISTDIML